MAKDVKIIISADDQATSKLKKVGSEGKSFSEKMSANLWKIKIASGLVTAWIIAIWKEFFQTWKELELMDRKATVVLWDFKKQVQDTAKVVASRMGMTNMEFTTATANIADLLVPMGFVREEAVKMATDTTKLAGALAEWSNGTYDAKQASEILSKAMLGETEQLKMMWVKIDQSSKQFTERIKLLMTEKNLTLEQARALDIQRQIFEKSADAQKAYAEWAGSLIDQQQQLQIQFKNIKESISLALVPVFKKLMETLTPIITKISEWIQENPKLASNIFLIVGAISALTFWLTFLIPKITMIIWLMSWPLWLIALVWLLFVWLWALERAIVSTDERIAWYNEELRLLKEQYDMWLITQDQYAEWVKRIWQSIDEAKVKAWTLWQTLKDDLNETLRAMTHPIKAAQEAFRAFWIIVNSIWWAFDRLAAAIWEYFISKITTAVNFVRDAYNKIRSFIGLSPVWGTKTITPMSPAITWVSGWIGAWIWTSFWWFRAWGWNVEKWKWYVVGENWPEYFEPWSSWNIAPSWWNQNITVNLWGVAINNGMDANNLATKIANEIKRQTQLYNFWIS